MTLLATPSASELFFIPLFGSVIGLLAAIPIGLLWSPFLLSARIRRCFAMGPTRWWQANYGLTFALLGAVHAGLVVAGLLYAHDPTSTFEALVGPSLVVPATAWVAVAFSLRGEGDDQESSGATLGLVALGAVWYALLTGVPSFVVALFASLPS